MSFIDSLTTFRTAEGQLERLISGFTSNTLIGGENGAKVDTIFEYDYDTRVRLTENPVENGMKLTDHRIIEPKKLVLNVGVSNIVGYKDLFFNLDSATLVQFGKLVIFGNRFDSNSRVAATYTKLLQMQYTGNPFDVSTPLGTFKNMLIVGINKSQDKDSISIFKGSIEMQELIVFETKTSFTSTKKSGVGAYVDKGFTIPAQSFLPTGLKL